MKTVLTFIIAFVLPFIYFRSLFYLAKKVFDKPLLRTKTGLQIHHAHYGVVCILIGTLVLLFSSKSIIVVIMLGLGLGLLVDESVSLMLMPGNRVLELEVYRKSLKSTAFVFIGLVLAVFILAVFC